MARVGLASRRLASWLAGRSRGLPLRLDRNLLSWIGLGALGLTVLEWQAGRFGFYEDEGINLQKAAMVVRGYHLFSDIYSDQPPFYTWLLALCVRTLGPSYERIQHVAVLFGLATLLGACAIAKRLGGMGAQLCAAVVLLSAPPFLKFGTSIVVNSPSVCLAVWSVFLAGQSGGGRAARRLFLAGALLGAAIMTKLATIYFVPIVAAFALARAPDGASPGRWFMGPAWLSAGAALPILIVVAACPLSSMATQLVEPHVAALIAASDDNVVWRTMLLGPGMLAFYGATIASLIRADLSGRLRFSVALWVAVVAAWMSGHRPLWAHHMLDLIVPLAIGLSAAIGSAVRDLRTATTWSWRAVTSMAMLVALTAGAVEQARGWDHWRTFYDNADLATLRSVAGTLSREIPAGDWVLTDRPIIAFLADRPTPPGLTLLTQKRILGDPALDRHVAEAFERQAPAVVLRCTSLLASIPGVQARLAGDYEPVQRLRAWRALRPDRGGVCTLFRRRHVAPDGVPSSP